MIRVSILTAAMALTASACVAGASVPSAFAVNGLVAPTGDRHIRPLLAGTPLVGQYLDVRSWRGHVVVVNIWGAWCVPCREEAPDLARTAAKTAPEGVRFVGIDVRDNRAAAKAFERRFGIHYPSLFDADGALVLEFGSLAVRAVPYTYVLDTRGYVAARFIGRTHYEPLYETIELARTGNVPLR